MKFIPQMLSFFSNWNKLFYSFIAWFFSLLTITIFILLILMFFNFHDGLENQRQENDIAAIQHYDSVINYSQYIPAGLDFITNALNFGINLDKVSPVLNAVMHEDSNAEQISINIYQYTKDTIANTNIVVATYNNRGNSKIKLEDYEAAIDDYKKAIDEANKLNMDYAFAYNGKGIAKANLGHYKGAIADFDLAIKIDPRLCCCLQ